MTEFKKNYHQKHHSPRKNYGSQERKKQGIRGHDAALHHFQRSGDTIRVFLTSEIKLGIPKTSSVYGKLTQYDAYTVTLEIEGLANPLIIFKSNILGLTKAS